MKKVLLLTAIAIGTLLVGCAADTARGGLAPVPNENLPIGDDQQLDPIAIEKQSTNELPADQAQIIALQHAGYTEEQVSSMHTGYDFEDGIRKYDIEFYVDNKKYDYDIHASTGEILGYDYDINQVTGTSGTDKVTSVAITLDEAKTIVLEHAKFKLDQVVFTKGEYEVEDGIEKYDIEFYVDNKEYSYEVNALEGTIITYEQDIQ